VLYGGLGLALASAVADARPDAVEDGGLAAEEARVGGGVAADAVERAEQQLAAGPTRSYAGTKRALNQMLYGNLESQLELEADIQHELFRTNDVTEGVSAFVQKRQPSFTGS